MPVETNIALLVNTRAGNGKALELAAAIVQFLEGQRIQSIRHDDQWPAALENHTEVWVVGGDGTLNYFLNYYRNCNIPIVLFKGGTGNDFAWKLYGEMTLNEQLLHVLNAGPKPVDAARCNDKLFINGVGIGFDGVVLQSMKTVRMIGGHLGYLLIVLKKIFSFREFSFTIDAGSLHFKERFLLVMISNSSRTGGGFHVSPLADVTDGKLNMILCKPLSVLQRLRYLPVIERGKHLNLPFIQHITETSFVIKAETILPAQMDGELIHADRFNIEILPGFFKFKY